MPLIAAILLQMAPPPVQPTLPAPPPVAQWPSLPPLPLREPVVNDAVTRFVADEVRAGRCVAPRGVRRVHRLSVDMAVLVTPAGVVRRVVPRAVQCPTVEQFSVGLLSTAARGKLPARGLADTWYRATLSYGWIG